MTMIAEPTTTVCPTWCTEHYVDQADGSISHFSADRLHPDLGLTLRLVACGSQPPKAFGEIGDDYTPASSGRWPAS